MTNETVIQGQMCHVHGLLHEILDRLEILEGRTTSLQDFRASLRCPSCGSEMTPGSIVAVKE